jgi:hypothetical protein
MSEEIKEQFLVELANMPVRCNGKRTIKYLLETMMRK